MRQVVQNHEVVVLFDCRVANLVQVKYSVDGVVHADDRQVLPHVVQVRHFLRVAGVVGTLQRKSSVTLQFWAIVDGDRVNPYEQVHVKPLSHIMLQQKRTPFGLVYSMQ